MSKNILIFCAHSDDQILGPGGTIAYYAKRKYNVYSYIISYGETSHPHFKREIIIKRRVQEAIKANKVVKGSKVTFFGLKEGRFKEDIKKKDIKKTIKKIISEKKPEKIFTHNIDDPHPDHQETNKIITRCVDELKEQIDVYVFDIWNPISMRYRNNPRLIIDIKKTFKQKIDAIECFESQWLAMLALLWTVYLRAIIWGIRHWTGLAEVFYKIR